MAWVVCQCGWAACWGCEVRTMGVVVACRWGLWVCWVCRHVSVRVGAVRVQLGACWRACAVWGMGKARGGL